MYLTVAITQGEMFESFTTAIETSEKVKKREVKREAKKAEVESFEAMKRRCMEQALQNVRSMPKHTPLTDTVSDTVIKNNNILLIPSLAKDSEGLRK